MEKIGRLWAGKLFGTNTGNLAAELDSQGMAVTGTVRLMDDRFGPVVYTVKGSFDGNAFEVNGDAIQSPEGVANGTLAIKGALTPQGELRGQWSSTLGTGGTFHLFPHDAPNAAAAGPENLPERLHTAIRPVGSVRLYTEDVLELIGFLARDFSPGRKVVVTYVERGNEISRYSSDFVADLRRLGDLRYLKLSIQEQEAYGINRLASVELNANGSNEVRAQGVQESWVVGKAEAVTAQLRRSQKTFVTGVRKFGLNINGVLAIGALVVLPDLPVWRRVIFIGLIVLVAAAVVWLHRRFIPNALIHLSEPKPRAFERAWPQILSWVIAATAGVIALVAYGLLKGDFPSLFSGLFH